MQRIRLNEVGQTFLEVMIGVVILTLVGVAAVTALITHQRSSHFLDNARDSSTLAQMVFDQYASYASAHFDSLHTYDTYDANGVVMEKTPAEFFSRPDNMGFDRKLITTRTTYSTNRSTCSVHVTISSVDGSTRRTAEFERIFSDQLGVSAGATVRIRVIPACGTHQSASAIENNCPGRAGFTVSAPSMGAGAVSDVTDQNGYVTLRRVLVGESVPIEVVAPTPSEYHIPSSSPTMTPYVQGFWTNSLTGPGLSRVSNQIISAVETNEFVDTGFIPAGNIQGTLTHVTGAPLEAMEVRLSTPAKVFSAGSFKTCGVDLAVCRTNSWIDWSDPLNPVGRYEFSNVLISTWQSVALRVSGSSGTLRSHVAPDGSTIKQGHMNYLPVYVTPSSWTHQQFNAAPTAPVNLTIKKLGWFHIHFMDKDGLSVPRAKMNTFYAPGLDPFGNGGYLYNKIANDDGDIFFYNAIMEGWDNRTYITAESADGTLRGTKNWLTCTSNCADPGGTRIDVTLVGDYTFTGTIRDTNPSSPFPGSSSDRVNGMLVRASMSNTGFYATGTVDSAGAFTMTGLIPTSGYMNPQPTPNLYYVWSSISKAFVPANRVRLEGVVTDFDTGDRAPYARMHIQGANGIARWDADANGQFGVDLDVNWSNALYIQMICNPETATCVERNGNPVTINSALNSIYVVSSSSRGYQANAKTISGLADGSTTTGIAMTAKLQNILVRGTITELGLGSPVVGLKVKCVSNSYTKVLTTQAGGVYEGECPVSGRSSTNAGHISMEIDPGQVIGGVQFQGTIFSIPLPLIGSPVDITQYLTGNATVERISGGGI